MQVRTMGLVSRSPAAGQRRRRYAGAFTIVELMAATAILAVILAVIFGITQQISSAWKSSSSKIEAFQGARGAFSAMTQQISQATLNTYYDYYDSAGNRRTNANKATFLPAKYGRYSDLHFICGGWSGGGKLLPSQVTQAIFFQAPMGYASTAGGVDYSGMDTLLNACGYYITYNQDDTRPQFLDDTTLPNHPPNQYRFRLMQFMQPSQELAIYPYQAGHEKDWFVNPITSPPVSTKAPVRVLAENIIALIVLPKLSTLEDAGSSTLTSNFEYNSRPAAVSPTQAATDHQLPPVVEIIMVAIDEPSAQRVCTSSTMPDFGISGGLASLFKSVASLNDASNGTPGDLTKLTKALDNMRIRYRVFRSQVALKGAKWTP